MPSSSANSATTAESIGNIGHYSWEAIHDGNLIEGGTVGPGDEHPWTGDGADHPAYEIGNTLFEWACECALQDCHDAIVEARAEGRPEPAPAEVVTVRLRDRDGTEVVTMTARLTHKPVTEDDIAEYRNLMAAYDAEARAMEARRSAALDEVRSSPLELPAPHPHPPIDRFEPPAPDPEAITSYGQARDPRRQVIDDLTQEADELRGSVLDPEDVRHKLFHAEQRLTEAQNTERRIAATSDDAALIAAADRTARFARRVTYWQSRLADSTETYLQAAALTTEARYRERELTDP